METAGKERRMEMFLPLTVLLLGLQMAGQAIPLPPLNQTDVQEPVIFCQSMSYQTEGSRKQEMQVGDFSLGDMLKLIDPTLGAACDSSAGVTAPDLDLRPHVSRMDMPVIWS